MTFSRPLRRPSGPDSGAAPVLVSAARPRGQAECDVRREADLAQVRADLALVQARILARKREIALGWSRASTADRLLAVDRFLRDGNLDAVQIAEITARQDRARSAFYAVRAERKSRGEETSSRLQARRGAELSACEAERDRFIGMARLTEELWRTSETFVLPSHVAARHGPFRELLAFEALLEQRLLHLEQQPSPLAEPEPEPELPTELPSPPRIQVRAVTSSSRPPFHHRLLQLLQGAATS